MEHTADSKSEVDGNKLDKSASAEAALLEGIGSSNSAWHAPKKSNFRTFGVGIFGIGLASAVLVALVVAGFTLAAGLMTNWDSTNPLYGVWSTGLFIAGAMIGLLAAVALPIVVLYKQGLRRVLLAITLEALLLVVGLVGLGFYLNNAASNGSSPYSGGGGCGRMASDQICNY